MDFYLLVSDQCRGPREEAKVNAFQAKLKQKRT